MSADCCTGTTGSSSEWSRNTGASSESTCSAGEAVEDDVAVPPRQLGARVRPGENARQGVVAMGVAAPLSLRIQGQLQVGRLGRLSHGDDLDPEVDGLLSQRRDI